ncbi:S24/S26 family peptidase [Phenylobacterium sp. NIBR 498073]|uniref:S24 family peptidase n=1 Tax=Phenylobacterium sp. NIBR 498073 TaxID=3015177 RepID=UPI0022B3159E|nr:S24/S26 family peptidase [Phenylobacterium sp. NIBR 498073]WGU39017.1 S24/S26 family peptidase [Phenylobacterium sp. NIBR 498073]
MSIPERAERLKAARRRAGFKTAAAAAAHFNWNRNTYSSNENGNAPYSYKMAKEYGAAFDVSPQWLYDGLGASDPDVPTPPPPARLSLVPVIGRVGADTEGRVLFASGQEAGDLVPLPPGGTDKAVALRIVGHSMRGVADEGGLIYFEDQRTPPTPDMFGHVVVVETLEGEVLVKRLLRGSRSGRYDLESVVGPVREDARIRWAAHITAIIPPHQARRILRSA